jgi:hypothetical protein
MGMIFAFLRWRGAPWAVGAIIAAAMVVQFGDRQYKKGFAAAETEHAAEIVKMQISVDSATAVIRNQATDLEKYRNAARMLAMELDNEILSDGNSCVPSPDELQRARDRWKGSN